LATTPNPAAAAGSRTFGVEELKDFTTRVFKKLGVPPEDAELASEVLSSSDRRGIDSHGVGECSLQ
jgi:L-2-hydroxycarboxylate dehydrogenase (NAD+)